MKHLCILLKVQDIPINDGRYHNNYIYYPVEFITGIDYEDVCEI